MQRTLRAALFGTGLLMAFPAQAATLINTQAFLDRFFGVNIHLSNCCNGNYGSTTQVITELQYIGATHLRDGPIPMNGLLDKYQAVYRATGARFSGAIEMGSPARQRACLDVIRTWLKQAPGLMNFIEGGNEEDTAYPKSQGATLADTANLQNDVYNVGKAAGVKVTQMSVGAGWVPPLWEGNYKNFGHPPADYGNAHVYLSAGQTPTFALKYVGNLAAWSVNNKPVDVTEYGIFQGSQQSPALTSAYMHIGPFSSYLLGQARLAVYALHDDSTRAIGFYDAQGKARAHANYWHVTSRLLADPAGRNLPTRTASITFSDLRSAGTGSKGIRNVPMFKSDGSVWIAAYDEEASGAADGYETVTLDRYYPVVQVIDGRTGVAVTNLTNTNRVTIRLPANQLFFVVGANSRVNVKL